MRREQTNLPSWPVGLYRQRRREKRETSGFRGDNYKEGRGPAVFGQGKRRNLIQNFPPVFFNLQLQVRAPGPVSGKGPGCKHKV